MGTSRVCIWIAPQLFMLFFCTASRTTELCTLSLHDALPIFWTTQTAFNNALLAGHDYGTGDLGGHLSYVIYSATRFRRGDSNYYFDATSISRSQRVHWLRSRDA